MHAPSITIELTFDLDTDLQNIWKNSEQLFSEPTRKDKHFEI